MLRQGEGDKIALESEGINARSALQSHSGQEGSSMNGVNRREFLGAGVAGLAAAAAGGVASRLWANPLGLPIGLALYTVREQLRQDVK